MIYTLLISSFSISFLPHFARTSRQATMAGLIGSSIVFLFSTVVGVRGIAGQSMLAASNMLYVDAFAGMMVLLIGFVQWTAAVASAPYLEEEEHEGIVSIAQVRRYYMLFGLFVTSMLATVMSNNLGLMWIALEATTLATALLVAFYSRKGSLEAAWKYLILCSTGISLGLLGLLIMYHDVTSNGLLSGLSAMNWTNLHSVAGGMQEHLLKVAFIFVLIGFGTKVGLVPMHSWLPDAHSSAPSPISGLLSGVLLNAALFAVIRYKTIVDVGLGGSVWSGELLIIFGLLSCVIPAAFIITQTDYKRILAYSSIEHMGLISIGIGVGGVGTVAAVIHMIGHALSKSTLFYAAGNILLRYKSTKFHRVSGVMTTLPYSGSLFVIGMLALLAVPPSPLFASEYLLVAATIAAYPAYLAVVLIALAIIFAGFIYLLMPFIYARISTAHENTDVKIGEEWNASHLGMALQLSILVVFGFTIWTGSAYPIIERIAITLGN